MNRACPLLAVTLAVACSAHSDARVSAGGDSLVVFEAASLAAPMRAALDSFSRRGPRVVALEEHGGSLELARRMTDLHRVPDVMALADHEVFPLALMPQAVQWYAVFARNRMVIAFTDKSHHASDITADNWWRVVTRGDVLLGRPDPVIAPAGYRALLLYQLAEAHYRTPGLAAKLEARTPPRLVRGNAAELAGLLAAGELDYIVEYESLARAQHFRYLTLPPEIDLGDARQARGYASVSVRVPRGRDTVQVRGAPILYGVSIPRAAPHAGVAARFVQFLLGPAGRQALRAHGVDALDVPLFVGDSVPPTVRPGGGS